MKLLNYTTSYFAAVLLVVIPVWAAIFYLTMLDEIYDSMDDGLDNQKQLVIQKAATDSTVLVRPTFEEGSYNIKEISAAQAKKIKETFRDTLMYMQNEDEFEPVRMLRTAFGLNNRFYEMRVITSMVEEDDLIDALLYYLFWLYAGLICTTLILNNFILSRIWRPFNVLLQRLQNFRLENPQLISIEKTNVDEFRLLNQTVVHLLQSNIDTYTSQKQFIQNAAHELQTPVAISLNKLEILAESENLSAVQLQNLASAMHHLQRLTQLNKSLLLLTKIQNKQFTGAQEINLNQVIKSILADFADQFAHRQVEVNFTEQAKVTLHINPDLLHILCINLIKNAFLHNHKNGFIYISMQENAFLIQNSGSTTPINEKEIFTRFSKGASSTSSNGLGLAIVKAIVDLYHFRISYTFAQYHQFLVQF